MQEIKKEAKIEYDYSVVAKLFEFIESELELLPILCGYFNKINQALLIKSRIKYLTYVLLVRNGDLFEHLLRHSQHHSLALLLNELMNVKF